MGLKASNAYGLLDALGNVAEWTQDTAHQRTEESQTDPLSTDGTVHIRRGGSFRSQIDQLRSAFRDDQDDRSCRSRFVGFRAVRAQQ